MTRAFVDQLKSLCAAHPVRAKWAIVPSHGVGRMLGDRVALEAHGWANLRFVTPLDLALRMGAPFLVERGIDPSEEGLGPALAMRLLLDLPPGTAYFRPLAGQPQMAIALWDTLRQLRMAGLRASDLEAGSFVSPDKRAELVAVLAGYESFLARESRGDRATVFQEALQHPEWCPVRPDDCWVTPSDVVWAPLERQLIDMLPGERIPPVLESAFERPRRLRDGASPWIAGAKAPGLQGGAPATETAASVAMFHAGGAEAEVEEVFRRILASGQPLDRVEIACASSSYVPLVWEKALRYEWPITLGAGIPAALTRPGRALLGYAEWVEDDFSAGLLRRLLESGDVSLGRRNISPARAARLVVKAGAAWGRDTYRLALGRLAASARRRALRDDVAADERDRLERRAVEADMLAAWIGSVIDAVPVPDDSGLVALQDVVEAADQFIAVCAARTSALDHLAANRLSSAIGELRALRDTRCTLGQALRFVRERVEGLGVGGDRARPGHLFVSMLPDASVSGRSHLFVVGLEEGCVFPPAFEDPVLLDDERAALHDALRRSADLVDESVYRVLTILTTAATSPGQALCLSYSSRDLRQFRETYASWLMLHVLRLVTGNPATSYRDLHDHLGPAVSTVPADPAQALGPGRWWLHGMRHAPADVARAALFRDHPMLAAGVRADEARVSDRFTEFDGFVPAVGVVLDPCGPTAVVSPTQLEEAAACPFRYFLRRGLKVDAIETGERNRDVWLDPLIRGSLLHDVYAAVLRRCRDDGRRPNLDADREWLRAHALQTLDDLAREMPPPSFEVGDRETRDFLADVDLFLVNEVDNTTGAVAVGLEVGFGRGAEGDSEPLSNSEAVTVRVGGLTFRIAGRVDRIDRLADGTFEIVDYKTGGYWEKDWQGTFAGGRRLQHALYALAAVELLRSTTKAPRVSGAQYYFSSTKGRARRKVIPAQTPAAVGRVLGDLRDVVTAGLFVHTPDDENCRFCDYGPACGGGAHERAAAKLGDPSLAPFVRLNGHE